MEKNYELECIALEKLVPKAALVVYLIEETNDCYVEMREIIGKQMGAGKPLTEKCIKDLVMTFNPPVETPLVVQKKTIQRPGLMSGFIPENMIYISTNPYSRQLIWYNPPQKRKLYFTKQLHIKNDVYDMPGIVYHVNDQGGLYVYGFKEDTFNRNVRLYYYPCFNISNCNVCTGSANISYPDHPTFETVTEYWEKRFWCTRFSHFGSDIHPTKDNLVTVIKQSKERFDREQMVELPRIKTINDLII